MRGTSPAVADDKKYKILTIFEECAVLLERRKESVSSNNTDLVKLFVSSFSRALRLLKDAFLRLGEQLLQESLRDDELGVIASPVLRHGSAGVGVHEDFALFTNDHCLGPWPPAH